MLSAAALAKVGVAYFRRRVVDAMSSPTPTQGVTPTRVVDLHAEPRSADRRPGLNGAHFGVSGRVSSAPNGSMVRQSLLEMHELQAYRGADHEDAGYRAGVRSPDSEMLECARLRMVAVFDDLLNGVIEHGRGQIDDLEATRLRLGGPNGVSPLLVARLGKEIEVLQREIVVLEEQRALAQKGLGWLRPLASAFQIGFRLGAEDALKVSQS